MSSDTTISDSKVFTVYSWFQDEMRRIGRKINLPKCRDQTKTYQFRWTRTFANRCYNELSLDDKVVRILIASIVDYAKKKKVLDRGTQILCMSNIADICYQSLKDLADDESSLIMELRSCRDFLREQTNDKNTLVCELVEPSPGGFSNLLYWYNQGFLTEVFMALSIDCSRALARLPEGERQELPSRTALFRICTHTVSEDLLPQLKAVMGSDLRIPPTATIK